MSREDKGAVIPKAVFLAGMLLGRLSEVMDETDEIPAVMAKWCEKNGKSDAAREWRELDDCFAASEEGSLKVLDNAEGGVPRNTGMMVTAKVPGDAYLASLWVEELAGILEVGPEAVADALEKGLRGIAGKKNGKLLTELHGFLSREDREEARIVELLIDDADTDAQ